MLKYALCYKRVKSAINRKINLFWMGRWLFYTVPGFGGIVLSLHLKWERRKSEREILYLLASQGSRKMTNKNLSPTHKQTKLQTFILFIEKSKYSIFTKRITLKSSASP